MPVESRQTFVVLWQEAGRLEEAGWHTEFLEHWERAELQLGRADTRVKTLDVGSMLPS